MEAPWQRGGIDSHPKHTGGLGTKQFVGCVSSYLLVWAELSGCYFLKRCVVRIPSPMQAELNDRKQIYAEYSCVHAMGVGGFTV